jgi:hypothetical protein
MDPKSCPDFDDLPKVEGMPQGCAWGVFDKDGKKDVYGTLNFLTPQIVLAAAAEVKEGISISLKHVDPSASKTERTNANRTVAGLSTASSSLSRVGDSLHTISSP